MMVGKYDVDPLGVLYTILLNHFTDLKEKTMPEYNNIDPIMEMILKNNSCAFKDNCYAYERSLGQYSDSVFVVFIYGAIGNDANKYFDFIEFYGAHYYIIFMDEFKGIIDPRIKYEEDPLGFEMGKSDYFDQIKNIVDMFINIEFSTQVPVASAAASRYRLSGIIIAASIINEICDGGFTEQDYSGMKYEECLRLIAEMPMSYSLVGIRYRDEGD